MAHEWGFRSGLPTISCGIESEEVRERQEQAMQELLLHRHPYRLMEIGTLEHAWKEMAGPLLVLQMIFWKLNLQNG